MIETCVGHKEGLSASTEFPHQGNLEAMDLDRLDVTIKIERVGPIPRNGGQWTGMPGNSTWRPDRNVEPGDRHGTNPEHKTWGEILDRYGIEGITFHDSDPDFSEVAKGTVEIDDFCTDRDVNFAQADEKLAEQEGCAPEEVAQWRKEHGYTWHECKDCKTMQMVPSDVHGNISHSGGISAAKQQVA